MEERRHLERRHLIYYMRIFDRETDLAIGRLCDLTPEGIMLISETPIETEKTFNLRLVLPEQLWGIEEYTFEAESVWCKPDVIPEFYNTGFKLLDDSEQNKSIFERLIHEFEYQE
ncbi:MAG: hypothetical protein FVQ83_16490 [Chloroflexi bacterium]|nr:hypothetical protein [Chloroflexota bacterium]